MPPRRLIADAKFQRAVKCLGSRGAEALVRQLARRLAEQPQCGTRVSATDVHQLLTRSHAGYPALRLFYTFDAYAVYLLHVERYDELTASVEEEG
jgi:hypothetical protein